MALGRAAESRAEGYLKEAGESSGEAGASDGLASAICLRVMVGVNAQQSVGMNCQLVWAKVNDSSKR